MRHEREKNAQVPKRIGTQVTLRRAGECVRLASPVPKTGAHQCLTGRRAEYVTFRIRTGTPREALVKAIVAQCRRACVRAEKVI